MLDEWELFEEKRRTTRLDIIKQQLFLKIRLKK
jgi:hypothetical protein